MSQKPIPVNEIELNGNEAKYVQACIESGWISGEGPFVKQFEHKMAESVGRKHALAVSNGTTALELAVAALDLEPGSEIIVPTLTIISCVAAIVRRGCVPVLVDSDPDTWNMNAERIEEKITSRTKAIMAVHLYGLPSDMDTVFRLARKYDLKVIEDASQMIGQTYNSKPCGSLGDVSTFSFYANKHITTGEGGMVLTDDNDTAERANWMRDLCFDPVHRFKHEELGYNFRMSNLQAAVGLAQLERLDETARRKRDMGRHYTELLAKTRGLELPIDRTRYAENIYWVYGIVLEDEAAVDAERMIGLLKERKIGSRPFFWPMHEQPVFRRLGLFEGEVFPVAERLARRGLYIPSGTAITASDRLRVAGAIIEIMEGWPGR